MAAVSLARLLARQTQAADAGIHRFEEFSSIVCGDTITALSPQLLDSMAAKLKEEDQGWLQ